MWIEYNPNPCGRRVGDCAVRAISKALGMTWEGAFVTLALNALQMCDMPSSDSVIGATLRQNGFVRKSLPISCPDCYTVEDFCREYPTGTYVLFFGGHVCCVENGNDYDAWDSTSEIPQYFWTNERSN